MRSRHARAAEHAYDYVLIDCPPSLNLLTVNAMAASDAVLVPLQCEFFALEGLSQLLRTIELVRAQLNPALEIHGLVLTMFDRRNNLRRRSRATSAQLLGAKVYETMIPRNVRVSEAPSCYGKPALIYDLKCVGRHCIRSVLGRLAGNDLKRKPIGNRAASNDRKREDRRELMARSLSIVGFLALAIGLLWIGQGTGTICWPTSSFMINELQWAGYGALLGAIGLILIWQGNR